MFTSRKRPLILEGTKGKEEKKGMKEEGSQIKLKEPHKYQSDFMIPLEELWELLCRSFVCV
jgi:hypothetical protein